MARCEFNRSTGQCTEEALPNDKFCSLHTRLDPEKNQKRLYNLLKFKYRSRYEEIGDHEALRSLRDEVAISKMMLEENLNSIQNDSEFAAARGNLAQQLVTVEKLVSAMIKMEVNLGTLISKPTLLKIASDIVRILLEELKDVPGHELIIDKVSLGIMKTINSVKENLE